MDLGFSQYGIEPLRSCHGKVAGVAGHMNAAVAANRGVRIQRSRRWPQSDLAVEGLCAPADWGLRGLAAEGPDTEPIPARHRASSSRAVVPTLGMPRPAGPNQWAWTLDRPWIGRRQALLGDLIGPVRRHRRLHSAGWGRRSGGFAEQVLLGTVIACLHT